MTADSCADAGSVENAQNIVYMLTEASRVVVSQSGIKSLQLSSFYHPLRQIVELPLLLQVRTSAYRLRCSPTLSGGAATTYLIDLPGVVAPGLSDVAGAGFYRTSSGYNSIVPLAVTLLLMFDVYVA